MFSKALHRRFLGIALILVFVFLAGCEEISENESGMTPFSGVLIPPPSSSVMPPEGTVAPSWSGFDSIGAAQGKAPFTLMVPGQDSLPAGYSFSSVQILSADNRQVITLIYKSETGELDVQEQELQGTLDEPEQPFETMKIRGTDAYLVTVPKTEWKGLVWTENGLILGLSGNLNATQLAAVAESLTTYTPTQ